MEIEEEQGKIPVTIKVSWMKDGAVKWFIEFLSLKSSFFSQYLTLDLGFDKIWVSVGH